MKTGTKVAVCHDGKWMRRVEGVIVETRRGFGIKVKFVPFASDDDKEVCVWFRKGLCRTKYGGPRHKFTGYVPDEVFGWYRVFKWADHKTTY